MIIEILFIGIIASEGEAKDIIGHKPHSRFPSSLHLCDSAPVHQTKHAAMFTFTLFNDMIGFRITACDWLRKAIVNKFHLITNVM